MKQLRITVAISMPNPLLLLFGVSPLMAREEIGETEDLTNEEDIVGKGCYFDDNIIERADNNNIPIMIDGNMLNFDRPKEEQDILLLLPGEQLQCVATVEDYKGGKTYKISLK